MMLYISCLVFYALCIFLWLFAATAAGRQGRLHACMCFACDAFVNHLGNGFRLRQYRGSEVSKYQVACSTSKMSVFLPFWSCFESCILAAAQLLCLRTTCTKVVFVVCKETNVVHVYCMKRNCAAAKCNTQGNTKTPNTLALDTNCMHSCILQW